jgi:hypothetical protein
VRTVAREREPFGANQEPGPEVSLSPDQQAALRKATADHDGFIRLEDRGAGYVMLKLYDDEGTTQLSERMLFPLGP